MINHVFKLILIKCIVTWLIIGVGLWMDKKKMNEVFGRRQVVETISWVRIWLRLKGSLSLLPSLCSLIIPQKNQQQKETPEDLRAALFSEGFKWWEKFWQNKRAHLLEIEKRGNYPPVTASSEWKDAGRFPSYQPADRSHFPRHSLVSYRQRSLSNHSLPQKFYLLSLTEKTLGYLDGVQCRLPRLLCKPEWLY